jgi:hypothetical protein
VNTPTEAHGATSRMLRWLPGLRTLRSYEPGWLRHDIVAGLVLTTMLVPVGIAYAEASGVPGIYGLYATIVPLLAYALFGPSRILVLGPRLGARTRDSRRRAAVGGRRSAARGGARRCDGHRRRSRVHRCRHREARLRHRAPVETDPLWLHERHRAHRAAQPAAEAFRVLRRRRGTASASAWIRAGRALGQDQHRGIRRGQRARSQRFCCCSTGRAFRRF